MTGRMSAAGRLGAHKYEDPGKQDFTSRTYYIAEDIKAKLDKTKSRTIENLNTLELKAINRAGGKLRPVLQKGFYKYKP